MFVLDSHCDTPSQILRHRDMGKDNEYAHVDFPKLRHGGVDGAFFALYVPASLEEEDAFVYACRLMESVDRMLKSSPDQAVLSLSEDQAYRNKRKGLFSVFLGLENGTPLGKSIDRLHFFFDAGVRYITLCHSRDNQICDSCASATGRWKGLSPYGREIIAEMNRIGMLIDVSHISDNAFYDVLDLSTRPVVATHSCCRALSDHPRNMTDDMIRKLAQAGGVIQINFYPLFIDAGFRKILDSSGLVEYGEQIEAAFINDPSDPVKRAAWNKVQKSLNALSRPSFRKIADHIDHVVSLVGIDHVGIGSDFDGIEVVPDGLEDISMMPVLFDELSARGYGSDDLKKIAGANFFRVLSAQTNALSNASSADALQSRRLL